MFNLGGALKCIEKIKNGLLKKSHNIYQWDRSTWSPPMLVKQWMRKLMTCWEHSRWWSWGTSGWRDCSGSSGSPASPCLAPPRKGSPETCSTAKTFGTWPKICASSLFNIKSSTGVSEKPVDGQGQVFQLLPGSPGPSLLPQLLLGLFHLLSSPKWHWWRWHWQIHKSTFNLLIPSRLLLVCCKVKILVWATTSLVWRVATRQSVHPLDRPTTHCRWPVAILNCCRPVTDNLAWAQRCIFHWPKVAILCEKVSKDTNKKMFKIWPILNWQPVSVNLTITFHLACQVYSIVKRS